MIIGVQNKSTLVSNQDAYAMTLLVNRQVRDHVAPSWGLLPPMVIYLPGDPGGLHLDAIIGILDDADQAGDLGWHTEGPDASVYGRVFARPVLENGGNALTADLSVCSVLSHEVIETLGDPSCNRWAQQGDGSLVAIELADPVESDSYRITLTAVGGESVSGMVSNFVLPSWFDPDAAGPADYCGLVSLPFQIRDTGYAIVMSGGTVTEKWGREYPAWRKATKQTPAARTARREEVFPQAPAAGATVPTSLA